MAIAPPPAVAEARFVALFNGKDLTGWTQPKFGAAAWRVENGVLIGPQPRRRRAGFTRNSPKRAISTCASKCGRSKKATAPSGSVVAKGRPSVMRR